jgi:hypothetical protein
MKILIVGCGAVGQVLGLFLKRSGVDLGYYARPSSAEALRQALGRGGLPLMQITYRHRRHPATHVLDTYEVVTDLAGSQRFAPDQIWFTVPSPVYYSEWFRAFLNEVPSERVVCFAPEGRRPELLPDGLPEDRLVFGGITFIAWQGDLGKEGRRSQGVTFWLPPGLGIPLVGAQKACLEVAETLRGAGFRSDVQKLDYSRTQASVTAVMSGFVAGLELSGWSLRAYRASPWLGRAARGSREAVLGQLPGAGVLTKRLLGIPLSPVGFFVAACFLPLLFPFDLEAYLRFHYLKTREQTIGLLSVFEDDAGKQGLPVINIQTLLQALQDPAQS